MARSSYIYIVQNGDGLVLAAFTVKHELSTWLDQNGGRYRNPKSRDDLIGITRIQDGFGYGRAGSVVLSPRTLEPVA
jgi:hypothetical protein